MPPRGVRPSSVVRPSVNVVIGLSLLILFCLSNMSKMMSVYEWSEVVWNRKEYDKAECMAENESFSRSYALQKDFMKMTSERERCGS